MTDQLVLTPHAYNRFLLLVAGLGGLLYGVDVGIIAGALPYLEATSGLNAAQLLNVDTVVLPNLYQEEGSEDPDLCSRGDFATTWHQFVRVWYKV